MTGCAAADPAGVDALRAELGIDPAAVIVLCVGRMVPKKGSTT